MRRSGWADSARRADVAANAPRPAPPAGLEFTNVIAKFQVSMPQPKEYGKI
jgi:hypothetical protein